MACVDVEPDAVVVEVVVVEVVVTVAACSCVRSWKARRTTSPAVPPKAKYWVPAALNEPLTSIPYLIAMAWAVVVLPLVCATGE